LKLMLFLLPHVGDARNAVRIGERYEKPGRVG
jgi:hypothetical protein